MGGAINFFLVHIHWDVHIYIYIHIYIYVVKINMLTHYIHIFVDICLQQLEILVHAARSSKQRSMTWEMKLVATHLGMFFCFFAVCFGFILEDPNESPMLCYYSRMGKDSKVWALAKNLKGRMTIPQCQEFETQFCCHSFTWPHLKS